MADYRPLPTPPAQGILEGAFPYSHRLLLFLMESDCYATLSDSQLDLVEMAAARSAVSLPAKLEPTDALFASRLTEVRHTVALVLRTRKALDAQMALAAAPEAFPTGGAQKGRPAPLVPPTPSLPPAPAYAFIDRLPAGGRDF